MRRRELQSDVGRGGRLAALIACLAAVAVSALGFASTASAQTDSTAVTIPGNPLTVDIGPRGECQSSYLVNGEPAGNYYLGSNVVGDCGFFLAFPAAGAGQPATLQNKTFGFDGLAGPFLSSIYTPISQSPVTGAGTEASPFSQTTVFAVEAEGKEWARVTEVTTYVNGAPQFTSTFTVKNTSAGTVYFSAVYAGDLYVNGSDVGTGVFLGGPPRFIGGQNTGSGVIGGFQEVGAPSPAWTNFQELDYPEVWRHVEGAAENENAFNDTIEPNEVDNAAGVEWNTLRATGLKPGGEQVFSIINRTQIPSTLKFSPVSQTLTQGQTETVSATAVDTAGAPYAGKALRYTVTGANPQSGSVTLNSAGQAQISYVGNNAGIDTIQMFVDLGGTGSQTPSDPSGTATVTFLPKPPPPPTPNSSYKVQSIKANSNGTITITFVPTQGGTATLEVTVPTATITRHEAEAAKKKCKKGLVKIKGKCLRPTTVSGKLSATGIAGVRLSLTVNPSSKVKNALKKGRTVALTATLTYKSALGGSPTVETFHFTVKPKKKHH